MGAGGSAVTILGPQRRPSVQHAVPDLPADAVVAVCTAGWQERESDDAELSDLLERSTVNLSLHARWLDVQEQDREFAFAEREHEAALSELRQLYLVQLDHALQATYAVAQGQEGRPRLRERALAGAVEVVRLLDGQHLERVRDAQLAFFAAWLPQEREAVARHREEVEQQLASADAIVVAGGHVGHLTRLLHLFHVAPLLPEVVVAWSAGAMALTERVVLFHDNVPHGIAQTEVFGEGIGVVPGLVLLPHARRRLRVDDPVRMGVLARRFAPAQCVVLDDGTRLALGPDGTLPSGARVVAEDGRIIELEAA
jgi:hypothetical protein